MQMTLDMDFSGLTEYRVLTLKEIGEMVRLLRRQKEWKQETLSIKAQVSLRSVQRIEKGIKVDSPTLGFVAEALGLGQNDFTMPQHLPSMVKVQEVVADYQSVEAKTLSGWRDFEAICRTHTHIIDDRQLTDDLAERSMELKQYITDCRDVGHLSPDANLVEYYKEMHRMVLAIEAEGYVTRYATYRTQDDFSVSTIAFFKTGDAEHADCKQFLVPNNFVKMAREW